MQDGIPRGFVLSSMPGGRKKDEARAISGTPLWPHGALSNPVYITEVHRAEWTLSRQ
jgi:hypothetical protein